MPARFTSELDNWAVKTKQCFTRENLEVEMVATLSHPLNNGIMKLSGWPTKDGYLLVAACRKPECLNS